MNGELFLFILLKASCGFLKKINLCLVALGLHCYSQAFSHCGEWGLLFIGVHGLHVEVASLIAEDGL